MMIMSFWCRTVFLQRTEQTPVIMYFSATETAHVRFLLRSSENGGKIRIYSTELKAGAELLMPSAGEKIGNGDRIAVVH